MSYRSKLSDEIKSYFEVLEPDFPKWLEDYIETPAMARSAYISNNCGMVYTKMTNSDFFLSNLDHSVAVALVVWHFTHDKSQTLAGLFHDIATPVFKHCVDVMNGDVITQESLENLTSDFIKSSPEIMKLLSRDGIKLDEVDDYHIYPIADNDSPRLAADRLEYSLSNALFLYDKCNLDEIRELYTDIEIENNEDNLPELGFKTKKSARKFVKITCEMSIIYRDERPRFSMQFIADVLKGLSSEGKLVKQDLFEKKESEIIAVIEKSRYAEVFNKWRNATKVLKSEEKPDDVYFVKTGSKVRYIDPLVKGERISKVCKIAKGYIAKNLAYDMDDYLYLGFKMPKSELENFLIKAKQATYANRNSKYQKSSRLNSKDYEFNDGNLTYHDTYFGSNSFIGEEIVYRNDKPIWGMNYHGSTTAPDLAEEIFDEVLRPALAKVDEASTLPARAPELFIKDEYIYSFVTNGNLDNFSGTETITKDGKEIYKLKCHGGKIE